MMSWGRQTGSSKAALVFFGTLLCVLLAMFAVERRVAAYPAHNIAAAATAATGIQKPDQIRIPRFQTFEGSAILVCLLALLAKYKVPGLGYKIESILHTPFVSWAPTQLAVRPPPTL
jgi:hypothetical protein